MRSRCFALSTCLFVLMTLLDGALAGDVLTGSVVGVVREKASGQPLANVEMVLVNEKTGVPSRTLTDANGDYVFELVSPGQYEISASLTGYATIKILHFGAILNTTRSVVPPILMERAQGGVTVSTPGNRAATVNTADSAQRMTMETEAVRALPLTGVRTFDGLALLAPGVFQVPASAGTGPGVGPGVGTAGQFSVNGQRGRNNNFLVDGSDNNDQDVGVRRQGYVSLVPQSMESVEQFQIVTGNYLAEFGRNSGSIANAVSKSGGNSIHGTLYEYFNDSALNARNPFDQMDGPAPGKSDYQRNQYGAAIGGPLVKDRAFWFGSFEQQRIKDRPEKHFAVPTSGQRNFFGYSPMSDSNHDGVDDLTDYFVNRGYFYTGLGGAAIWSLVPLPNNVGGPYGINTFTQQMNGDGKGTIFSVKEDTRISSKHTFTGRYNFTDDGLNIPVTGGGINSSIHPNVRTQNLSLFLNSIFSPRTANQIRVSYGRTNLNFLEVAGSPWLFGTQNAADLAPLYVTYPIIQAHLKTPIRTDFGQKSYGPFGTTGALGQMVIHPYSPIGVDVYNFPQSRVNNTFQYADTFTHYFKSHVFKAGVDIRRGQQNSRLDRNTRALAEFHGGPGYDVDGSAATFRGADLASIAYSDAFYQTMIADFNGDGLPDYDTYIGLRFTEYGFFFQDNWKIAPRLVLNWGVRYELNTTPTEVNGKIEETFANPLVGVPAQVYGKGHEGNKLAYDTMVAAYTGMIAGRAKMFDTDKTNWAPRVGIAWDPLGDGKTSVRAAYGLFYDQNISAVTSQSRNVFSRLIPLNSSGFNTPIFGHFILNRQWLNYNAPDGNTYSHLLPGSVDTIGAPGQYFGDWLGSQGKEGGQGLAFTLPTRKMDTPYAQHFHVTIERELFKETLFSIGFSGSRGVHLTRFRMPNGGIAGQPKFSIDLPLTADYGITILDAATVAPTRPQVGLGAYLQFENSSHSSFNSLQASAQRRLTNGLNFTASYVWAHATDDVSDVFGGIGFSPFAQSDGNLAAEHASANFDVRHRLTGSLVWDLPWQQSNVILGGWRLSGILIAQTGQPYTVNSSIDVNNDGILTDRLNTTTGIQEIGHGVVKYVLPSGSVQDGKVSSLLAPPGQNGSVGRNTFRAHGIATVDLGVFKTFNFGEQRAVELRGEFYNLFNRSHFGVPVRILESPAFGRAVDTAVNARQVQFAVKFSF